MRSEIKKDVIFILKTFLYSTGFFVFFELIQNFYMQIVSNGMVFFYLKIKGLQYLDTRLTVAMKVQPMSTFLALVLATPGIERGRRIKFFILGLIFFYGLDVAFVTSQLFSLDWLLNIEYFIRYFSVILLWIVFAYDGYLKGKFVRSEN